MFRTAIVPGNFGFEVERVLRDLHMPEAAVVSAAPDGFDRVSVEQVAALVEGTEGESFWYLRSDNGRVLPHLTLSGLPFGLIELAPNAKGHDTYADAVRAIWWIGDFGQELVWTPEKGIVLPSEHNYRQHYAAGKPEAQMLTCYWDQGNTELHMGTKGLVLGNVGSVIPQLRRRANRLSEHIRLYRGLGDKSSPVMNVIISGHAVEVETFLPSDEDRDALPEHVMQGIREIYCVPELRLGLKAEVLAY